MNEPVYRPPSVWITQAGLVPTIVTLAIALPISIVQCLFSGPIQACLSLSRLSAWGTGFLTLGLALLTFWGLLRRKRYGQWLAVVLLVAGMVGAIATSLSLQLMYHAISQGQPLPTPPHECWQRDPGGITKSSCGYSSYGEFALNLVKETLPGLLLGLLALRLWSSPAAKRFFHW